MQTAKMAWILLAGVGLALAPMRFADAAAPKPMPSAKSDRCKAAVGSWKYFMGDQADLSAAGAASVPYKEQRGRWRCLDPQTGQIEINWTVGFKVVDTLTLSPDGDKLTGRNSLGVPLSVSRMTAGAAPGIAKPAAKPPQAGVPTASSTSGGGMPVIFVNKSSLPALVSYFRQSDGARIFPIVGSDAGMLIEPGKTVRSRVYCVHGERVCFGGQAHDDPDYWIGVGMFNEYRDPSSCVVCRHDGSDTHFINPPR